MASQGIQGSTLFSLSYILVGAQSGAAICFLCCVQGIINFLFQKNGKKVPVWVILLHAATLTVLNIAVFAAWYDAVALLASLLFVASLAQASPRTYRVLYFLNSALWIIYDFLAQAYGNLFTHCILSAAILISIVISAIRKKRSEQS